ncbi:4-phosphoerythronate dehydrogenase [Exilibacterium tricleocarpae]|uniref:Erythronate-4-phosphate dehydrogenase n=1 Tax=Exilibacterium tricleocarpae TaxID=2591008 RepID=A0A545SS52_9GAMM|nr:4-phosphoerythronate dehydrogenase [Exilibacterium tricleocarpae]TQV67798.1 4-phosphoerythronate dehydrogenase [Exilibacterium tricleocarpae]
MKIVADENIPRVQAFFSGLGEVTTRPGRALCQADVLDADILLVRSVTRVDRALLEGSRVGFVGSCTIGVDHLDLEYLRAAGITYANAPGCNANAVVEYVFSALSALGVDWGKKTVGIIGCGAVGGGLYRRLTALGVACRCYDPLLPATTNPALTDLDTVLQADIISMHTPLTRSGPYPSYHLLGARELARLKPGTLLINAGRGAALDNRALLERLVAGAELQVVLDVWEPEPALEPALLDRIALGTPHIAGYSMDGKVRGTEMVFEALCRYLGTVPPVPVAASDGVDRRLLIDTAAPALWQIGAAVLQAYDIREDDRRLRQVAAQPATLGQGFDALRRDYPVRREFKHFSVSGAGLQAPVRETLTALGFAVIG